MTTRYRPSFLIQATVDVDIESEAKKHKMTIEEFCRKALKHFVRVCVSTHKGQAAARLK